MAKSNFEFREPQLYTVDCLKGQSSPFFFPHSAYVSDKPELQLNDQQHKRSKVAIAVHDRLRRLEHTARFTLTNARV